MVHGQGWRVPVASSRRPLSTTPIACNSPEGMPCRASAATSAGRHIPPDAFVPAETGSPGRAAAVAPGAEALGRAGMGADGEHESEEK